ncbi:YggU family protein [Candidatus Aerophobetes bacterium]|nr:YggU family protein [Candidatus Aerophobetes bacterium]
MQMRKTEDGIIFKVKVQPKASKNGIAGLYQDSLKIRLTAPPVEGKANKALIDFLSGWLGVKKSRLKIVSGHLSKIKLIEVVGEEKDLIQKIKKITKQK